MNDFIQEKLTQYNCKSEQEEEQAIKEIMQEIALFSLSKNGFFKHVAFQGGTCLRIFHLLSRFSEDLDFALMKTDLTFDLSKYLSALQKEFSVYDIQMEIQNRSHTDMTVKSAFLKATSLGYVLNLKYSQRLNAQNRKLKIKLEVDSNPPDGATYEVKYHDFPLPYSVNLFDLPSLFAGKLHALLCRNYVKGRDWYDFLWYIKNRTDINYNLLNSALKQQGAWREQQDLNIDAAWLENSLKEKIRTINWEKAKTDVASFLNTHEQEALVYWTEEMFIAMADKLFNYSRTV